MSRVGNQGEHLVYSSFHCIWATIVLQSFFMLGLGLVSCGAHSPALGLPKLARFTCFNLPFGDAISVLTV